MRRIDIGSGGGSRPAKDYDVYTDINVPKDPPTPFFQCAMEDMRTFKDNEFDFARCHHVIEHTNDPGRACTELIRIARAGIISFPPPQAEMMFGRRDHQWFVFIDRGRLLFVKKRHASYGVPRKVTGCQLNVNFEWEGGFEWQVVK